MVSQMQGLSCVLEGKDVCGVLPTWPKYKGPVKIYSLTSPPAKMSNKIYLFLLTCT